MHTEIFRHVTENRITFEIRENYGPYESKLDPTIRKKIRFSRNIYFEIFIYFVTITSNVLLIKIQYIFLVKIMDLSYPERRSSASSISWWKARQRSEKC